MASPTYIVEILDNTLTPITSIASFVPLNDMGDILSYESRLSESGIARFRVATLDPVLTRYGDILQPWANHVRIYRDGTNVWQGYIQDLPKRNKRFIEVTAYTYLEQLKKVLIVHDPITVDGEDMRTFRSGTMATVISAAITEIRNNATGLQVRNITAGTIENPNFPASFVNSLGAAIGNTAWTFSDNFKMSFDFVSWHYVLTAFGIYSNYDLELTPSLALNFKQRIGTDQPGLVFEYAQYGMIEDFESPLDGKNQANHIWGIAADNESKIIKLDVPRDQASIDRYGKLDGVAAFDDVKTTSLLGQRLAEELRLNSTPDTELHVLLNGRAYPLGMYGLGDTCTFRIQHGAINVDGLRQIIGIGVNVHNTGREKITLKTNKPRNR